jgi:hypothetical protein
MKSDIKNNYDAIYGDNNDKNSINKSNVDNGIILMLIIITQTKVIVKITLKIISITAVSIMVYIDVDNKNSDGDNGDNNDKKNSIKNSNVDNGIILIITTAIKIMLKVMIMNLSATDTEMVIRH